MNNLQIISIWWKVWWWKVFLCFLLLKAWVTELCPSECSYKVCAKDGMHFSGWDSTWWSRRGHCSTRRGELFRRSACPGVQWATAKFDYKLDNNCSFYLRTARDNRHEICSLQFGHFWAGTPRPSHHTVRSHSACMDVQSFRGAPAQYSRPVLF